MSFRVVARVAPLLFTVVTACGGGGSDAPSEPPTPVPPLTLSATSLSLVPGERSSLVASGGGGATVQWRSDDPAIVTVSATGEVTAVAPGSTEVVATRGSGSARASVTVGQGGLVGSGGGKVATTDSTVVVQVPTGSVPGTTKVEMVPVADPTGTAISAVLQVGPPGAGGTTLATPATIEITVPVTKVPAWADPSSLRIGRLVDGRWELLPTQVAQAGRASAPGAAAMLAARQSGGWGYSASITSWGTYSVVDPCSPVALTALSVTGSIARLDCPFLLPNGAKRFSDYYRFTIPNGEVQRFAITAGFVGIMGVKENTGDPTTGLVYGSMRSDDALARNFRVVGNGGAVQLFLSGLDSTSVGAYTITRSVVTDAHVCEDYDYVLPGATFSTGLGAANACSGTIQFTSDATVRGKPILFHTYSLKARAGVSVTITLGGLSAAFNPALTIFGYNPATRTLYVIAQSAGPAVSSRTLTVTPTYDGYIYPEVSSGQGDGKGGWSTPSGRYSLSVSSF